MLIFSSSVFWLVFFWWHQIRLTRRGIIKRKQHLQSFLSVCNKLCLVQLQDMLDSTHALNIFRDFNFSGQDKLIFTMDISSLYTVIPNSEGLPALKHFFDQRTVKETNSETLLRLAELVLTLNCFSFAGNYYKQINGVAMGTRMGPSYANLFVGYVEHQFFNQYNDPKPELVGRYIDDCIGAISSSREELDQFITSVNSFHPALKYTREISETSLAFLDIKVSISGNGLCTSVHYKLTGSHSYLLYSSSHPTVTCQELHSLFSIS